MKATLPGEVMLRFMVLDMTELVPVLPVLVVLLSALTVKLLTTELVQASNMNILLPDAAYRAPDTGRRHVTGSDAR